MAVQKQDDQHEHTSSSYVRIRDVVLKTYLGRWTIGRSGESGSGISVLPARYDDDDDIHATSATWWWWYIYIYIYIERESDRDGQKDRDSHVTNYVWLVVLFYGWSNVFESFNAELSYLDESFSQLNSVLLQVSVLYSCNTIILFVYKYTRERNQL